MFNRCKYTHYSRNGKGIIGKITYFYSKSAPLCCFFTYNVLSLQAEFSNINRFMMKLDMNNFVKLTLTS